VAARERSTPVVHVRNGHAARPTTRLRLVPSTRRTRHDRSASPASARAPGARQPAATDVGRRSRFRHRPSCTPHRGTAPGHAPPSARSGFFADRRPLRPHAPAVAVRRGRGPARREGRTGAEDAPHDHRRRAWRRAVAAVPRLRARCSRTAADRRRAPTRRSGPPLHVASRRAQGVRGRWAQAATRDRPPSPRAARRSGRHPRCVERGGQDAAGHRVPALRHASGALAAVDPTVVASTGRDRTRLVPRHQASSEAIGRHVEHGVRHRRRPRCRRLPRRARRPGRHVARLDGCLDTGPVVRLERLLAGAPARACRRDADRRPTQPARRQRRPARKRASTRWRRS
jgi:hypothetical protein